MSRFDTAYQTQVESNVIRPAWMLRLDMPSGVLAYSSWVKSFDYGGDTYAPKGIGFDSIFEGADLNSHEMHVMLPGTDADLVSQFIVDDYHWRDANLYLGLLDSDHNMIDTLYSAWAGRISYATITLGKAQNQIEVICEDLTADLQRQCTTTFTSPCQKRRYSGDTFFDPILTLKGKKVIWGGGAAGNAGVGGGGGGGAVKIIMPDGSIQWG